MKAKDKLQLTCLIRARRIMDPLERKFVLSLDADSDPPQHDLDWLHALNDLYILGRRNQKRFYAKQLAQEESAVRLGDRHSAQLLSPPGTGRLGDGTNGPFLIASSEP